MKKILTILILINALLFSACSNDASGRGILASNDTEDNTYEEIVYVPYDEPVYDNADAARKRLEEMVLSGEESFCIYTTTDVDDYFVNETLGFKNGSIIAAPKDSICDYIDTYVGILPFDSKTDDTDNVIERSFYHIEFDLAEDESKIESKVREITSEVTATGDKDKALELARAINDVLEPTDLGEKKLSQFYQYISQGTGDCLIYSTLYYLCAKELGLDVRMVDCETEDGSGHVFILCETDGIWYGIDPVWTEYAFDKYTLFGSESMNTYYTLDSRYKNIGDVYDISDTDY